MKNFFSRKGPTWPNPRDRKIDVTQPLPMPVAFRLSVPNMLRKPPRRLLRKGLAYVWAPAAFPSRHTVCRYCDKRTWTSKDRCCRTCFQRGEGIEVQF